MNEKEYNYKNSQIDLQYTTSELLFEKIRMEQGIIRAKAKCEEKIAELKRTYEDLKLQHERNKLNVEYTKTAAERGYEE